MKIWITFILLVAGVCIGSYAGNNEKSFRVFMDGQGRAIMLRVVKCDLQHDEVTVEREDERRLTVRISSFSKSDQEYIKEWFLANELIEERNLPISINKKTSAKDASHETTSFLITLENKTKQSIKNARIRYIIYYEQSERYDDAPTQKELSKEAFMKEIPAGEITSLTTSGVEVYTESATISKRAEGDVHGIRCRLIVRLSDDKEIYREFTYPRGLSDKKFPWK
ncbi:MAG: hypothetical protein JXR25_11700 [Pontiellaceae bacterium]|nr:hypothetical protein [Pontiellaceae bacterium]MBN2785479.1 hypothetical protein [Pontiellaceae bacterium]